VSDSTHVSSRIDDLDAGAGEDRPQPRHGLGAGDVAYRLIHNDTFPSWGFFIKHGATSIWELWNGWTTETGFGDPGMNSFARRQGG
jgi:hypothetical protein